MVWQIDCDNLLPAITKLKQILPITNYRDFLHTACMCILVLLLLESLKRWWNMCQWRSMCLWQSRCQWCSMCRCQQLWEKKNNKSRFGLRANENRITSIVMTAISTYKYTNESLKNSKCVSMYTHSMFMFSHVAKISSMLASKRQQEVLLAKYPAVLNSLSEGTLVIYLTKIMVQILIIAHP